MAAVEPETRDAVHIRRTFPAPRAEVFRAWTEPERVRQWFQPPGGSTPSAEMDVRVGGAYRVEMKSAVGWTSYAVGRFLEVEPPERLVYSFGWERPPPTMAVEESRVTVEFLDLGGSTELRLTHERLESRRLRAFHQWGWTRSLAKLERLLGAR